MDLALLKSERVRRGVTQETMAKSLGFSKELTYKIFLPQKFKKLQLSKL